MSTPEENQTPAFTQGQVARAHARWLEGKFHSNDNRERGGGGGGSSGDEEESPGRSPERAAASLSSRPRSAPPRSRPCLRDPESSISGPLQHEVSRLERPKSVSWADRASSHARLDLSRLANPRQLLPGALSAVGHKRVGENEEHQTIGHDDSAGDDREEEEEDDDVGKEGEENEEEDQENNEGEKEYDGGDHAQNQRPSSPPSSRPSSPSYGFRLPRAEFFRQHTPLWAQYILKSVLMLCLVAAITMFAWMCLQIYFPPARWIANLIQWIVWVVDKTTTKSASSSSSSSSATAPSGAHPLPGTADLSLGLFGYIAVLDASLGLAKLVIPFLVDPDSPGHSLDYDTRQQIALEVAQYQIFLASQREVDSALQDGLSGPYLQLGILRSDITGLSMAGEASTLQHRPVPLSRQREIPRILRQRIGRLHSAIDEALSHFPPASEYKARSSKGGAAGVGGGGLDLEDIFDPDPATADITDAAWAVWRDAVLHEQAQVEDWWTCLVRTNDTLVRAGLPLDSGCRWLGGADEDSPDIGWYVAAWQRFKKVKVDEQFVSDTAACENLLLTRLDNARSAMEVLRERCVSRV